MKQKIIHLKNKYSHIIMPLALIGGFVLDIFTLNQIDQTFDNAILIAHLMIASTSIALLFSRGTKFGQKFLTQKRATILQTLMVFSFGALFSGFVIFYTRSGSLLTSWPFVLSMLLLMLGTEFRKHYFNKLQLQIAVLYLAVISWTTFFIPVVIKKMGLQIFIVSTLVSIGLMFGYFALLNKINRQHFQQQKKALVTWALIIAALFNGLYFTNIIPPIPLSLKYQSVYYDVTRLYPGYQAQYEKTDWYNIFRKRSRHMYWRDGEDIFVFTQIFAPTHLSITTNHKWQFYDESNRQWVTRNTIPLTITGGRKDGYRGFSKKKNLEYGTWRVKTTTPDGKTLGMIRFSINPYGPKLHELVNETL